MRCILKSLSIVLLFTIQVLESSDSFTMAFSHKPSMNPQYKFYERIYTEAFHHLGYEFDYKIFPSKRSSVMANSGRVDGEPQRIFDYALVQPNLIRVEEPIFINRTLAFTTKPNIVLNGLESLKNTDYRVDYLAGSVWSRTHLEPLISSKNLSSVKTIEQGFKRLLYNRTDVFIALEVWALRALKQNEFKNSNIMISGVIGSNYSFPYLHKSHSKLAVKLENILKRMKKNGDYQKIHEESMPFLIIEK